MTITMRVDATSSAAALFLCPWNTDDVETLVEVYRDPTLRRWTSLPVENTEDAMRWLNVQEHGWKTGERLSFAVHEDQAGTRERRVAGYVALKKADPNSGSAEVAYWTAAHARGRGVAPRALQALTIWAFDTFAVDGLERLELLHQVDNEASCRVAEKTRYQLHQVLPAQPPSFPRDGHLHIRQAGTGI